MGNIQIHTILGDPGAVSRVDKMFVAKVYYKVETSPWALTLTEPVPEAFELPASEYKYNMRMHTRDITDTYERLFHFFKIIFSLRNFEKCK